MLSRLARFSILIFLLLMGFTTIVSSQDALSLNLSYQIDDVSSFVLSPDETQILILDRNDKFSIWDIASKTRIVQFDFASFDSGLNGITWSSDGGLIGAAFNDSARIWDATTGELLFEFGDASGGGIIDDTPQVWRIVFSPDEATVATADQSTVSLFVYDLETRTIEHKVTILTENFVDGIVFSPNGQYMAIRLGPHGFVSVWEVQSGKQLLKSSGDAMALSPDNQYIAISLGYQESEIAIWDIADGEIVHQIPTPYTVTQLLWSANGYLYANFELPSSTEWDAIAHGLRRWEAFGNTHRSMFYALEEIVELPSPPRENQTLIATYQFLKDLPLGLVFWDWERGEIVTETVSDEAESYSHILALTPITTFDVDEQSGTVVGGYDGGLIVWDMETAEIIMLQDTDERIFQVSIIESLNLIIGQTNNSRLLFWKWAG